MAAIGETTIEIRPFQVDMPDEALETFVPCRSDPVAEQGAR